MSSSSSPVPRTSTITREEFDATLSRYNALLDSVSASKSSVKGTSPSSGPSTLEDLDTYRLTTLPAELEKLHQDASDRYLTKVQLETLVRWKLKHGQFRPTLMALVSSNSPETIQETTRKAFAAYPPSGSKKSASVKESIQILTGLKGIGPATASLLLSVAYPDIVPFFGDEGFRWAFFEEGGVKDPRGWGRKIKYDLKEYLAYVEKVREICGRLGVRAMEVEMVGWVLGREALEEGIGKPVNGEEVEEPKKLEELPVKSEVVKQKEEDSAAKGAAGSRKKKAPTKRKPPKTETASAGTKTAAKLPEEEGTLRRSKRLRS